jgi:thiol-disulfide isomerase/thioredoxin
MGKKGNVILWVVVICVVFAALYTFYAKYKSQAIQQPQNGVSSTGSPGSTEKKQVMAPDFSLKDLNGNTVKLSDYKGKIVFLNFWATWCQYCKQEMPDLNELNKELVKGNDAVILAVDTQEKDNIVKDYLKANNIGLNVVLDSDGAVTGTYGVSGFPTTFVIDKQGYLYTYIEGATNKETLLGVLNKMK